jgi:hypothetical protein
LKLSGKYDAFIATDQDNENTGKRESILMSICFSQTPPDLVVKLQPFDIVDDILWPVLPPPVLYQREIKG